MLFLFPFFPHFFYSDSLLLTFVITDYSWWRLSSDLACYEQQDAHEFFISILDRIHDNLVEDQPISNHNGTILYTFLVHFYYSYNLL